MCLFSAPRYSRKRMSQERFVCNGERNIVQHMSLWVGDVALLEKVLFHVNSNNIQDKWGLTPLHLAVRLQFPGEDRLVRAISDSMPIVELEDHDGDTALQLAVSYTTEKSVNLLLEAGANVNTLDKSGGTPLHRAVKCGSLWYWKRFYLTTLTPQNLTPLEKVQSLLPWKQNSYLCSTPWWQRKTVMAILPSSTKRSTMLRKNTSLRRREAWASNTWKTRSRSMAAYEIP